MFSSYFDKGDGFGDDGVEDSGEVSGLGDRENMGDGLPIGASVDELTGDGEGVDVTSTFFASTEDSLV